MELTSLERLPLWIGGRAVAPSTTRYGEVTNPATGEVVRHVPLANAAMIGDADSDVEAGRRAGTFTVQLLDSCQPSRADLVAADLSSAVGLLLVG